MLSESQREKLKDLERENGLSRELARKEERSGPAAAREEEFRRRTEWKIRKEK